MRPIPSARFLGLHFKPASIPKYRSSLRPKSFSTSASSNKAAIVTGAGSQGIGRAVALQLAHDGFDVSINDLGVNEAGLKDVKREIDSLGKKCAIVVGDVSKEEDVKAMVETAVNDLGGVDVMVANAAILKRGPFVDVHVEELDKIYAVNLRGVFLCYKYAAMQMIKQGTGGRIIGASSLAGKQGLPGISTYSAMKFAVRGLTQSAASELGQYGITVNAYAPGAIHTDMVRSFIEITGTKLSDLVAGPVGRVGTPEEVADLVSYLASSKSGFITGQTISINGGDYFD